MKFRFAHASHPNWRLATELCLAQLDSQARQPGYSSRATLGFVYMTDAYADVASEILTFLKIRSGAPHWVGTLGIGVVATGVEYFDEPALVVMLADLAMNSFSVFSGDSRLPAFDQRTATGALAAHTALVHADPLSPDLPELIVDLSNKVESGWVFGGLSSSRKGSLQIADRTLQPDPTYGGSLSGVVFSSEVHLLSAVTQGCWPVQRHTGHGSTTPQAPRALAHRITAAEGNVIQQLDGRPALDVLLQDLGTDSPEGVSRLARLSNGLFAGLANNEADIARADYLTRHVLGLEMDRRFIVLAAPVELNQYVLFCVRDANAARSDLVRVCTELRDEIEHDATMRSVVADAVGTTSPSPIRGALYFSCVGRGTHLFGDNGAEMKLIQEHLGNVPLIGLFANGEIARHRLYGYAGVLSVFV